MWFFAKAHDAHASDGGDCKRCAKRSALCQLWAGTRPEAVLVRDGDSLFDILCADARRRQTNNGHKVTKIVSGFRCCATE